MSMASSNSLNNPKSFASRLAPIVKCIPKVGASLLAKRPLQYTHLYSGKYRLNNARNAAGFTGFGR